MIIEEHTRGIYLLLYLQELKTVLCSI